MGLRFMEGDARESHRGGGGALFIATVALVLSAYVLALPAVLVASAVLDAFDVRFGFHEGPVICIAIALGWFSFAHAAALVAFVVGVARERARLGAIREYGLALAALLAVFSAGSAALAAWLVASVT